MKKLSLLVILSIFYFPTKGQEVAQKAEAEAVVVQLFEAMYAADSATVRSLFHENASLQTVKELASGERIIEDGELNDFCAVIGTYPAGVLEERIWSMDTRVDGGLATVWTDYSFYVSDRLNHCGVNAFQLVKFKEKWLIHQIIDTRRKEACLNQKTAHQDSLHAFIDNWHKAAAVADEDAFFDAMAPDGIYIGTDKTERWLRDELRTWAAAAFQKESAWAFTAKDRQLYFSDDEQMVWWEELLDTWMGDCRGSGVAVWQDGQWQITHYHLSVTLANDKIESFIDLTKEKD